MTTKKQREEHLRNAIWATKWDIKSTKKALKKHESDLKRQERWLANATSRLHRSLSKK